MRAQGETCEPGGGRIFVLVTAAGSSSRFGGGKKELAETGGIPVLRKCLSAFEAIPDIACLVITHPAEGRQALEAALDSAFLSRLKTSLPLGLLFVEGGPTRQESVARGLEALAAVTGASGGTSGSGPRDIVLVHDAARPWVSRPLIERVIGKTRAAGACIPVIDLSDTPKQVSAEGMIEAHPQRETLKSAQTPQGFLFHDLLEAHRKARLEGWKCTDDSSLWDRYIGPVASVQGDRANIKITYREDLAGEQVKPSSPGGLRPSVGEGWDIHPLVPGRRLVLGGVEVPHDRGESGHSDGDVLWHAVMDALLGASCLGDIGTHFPPSDARWKDADSSALAGHIASLIDSAGFRILSLDSTVMLEKPRLGPWKDAIRNRMAEVLGISPDRVSVKAKTCEGFGPVGQGEAIEARAISLLERS